MGSRGPRKGACNAGRPRVVVPDEIWGKIDTLAAFQCPFTEIAETVGYKYTDLERIIRLKYNLSVSEYLDQKKQAGKARFRSKLFEMACDGKHPIVSIFCAKNWLGMMDEKTINRKELESPESKQALTHIATLLKRAIESKQSTNTRFNGTNIQDAEIIPPNTQDTPSLPDKSLSLSSTAQPDNNDTIEDNNIVLPDNNVVQEVAQTDSEQGQKVSRN